MLTQFLDRASRQVAGSAVGEPAQNAVKLGIVRILIGLVLAWRTFFIAWDSGSYFEPSAWWGMTANWQALAGWGMFALAVLLALGLASRTVAVVLMLAQAAYGSWTITYNLGPMLAIPMLGGLAVLGGGKALSLDALFGRAGAGPGPVASSRVIFLLFGFYAILHLSALLFHLDDGYWLSGKTTAVLLTNSYLSRFHLFFRAWDQFAPWSLYVLSIGVAVVQTLFQAAMIVLVFFRWGRIFVIVYGAMFAGISLLALQLSILPVVECILWFWLFLPVAVLPARWVKAVERRESGGSQRKRYADWSGAYAGVYGLIVIAFGATAVWGRVSDAQPPAWMRQVFFHAGLVSPNVFNRLDLAMGDRWPVVERIVNGRRERVPLNGENGQRLAYHRSDLLYYGNSLQWRRGMLDRKDIVEIHKQGGGMGYASIKRFVRYDYRRRHAEGTQIYVISIFENQASNFDVLPPDRYRPVLLDRFALRVDALRVRRLAGVPE